MGAAAQPPNALLPIIALKLQRGVVRVPQKNGQRAARARQRHALRFHKGLDRGHAGHRPARVRVAGVLFCWKVHQHIALSGLLRKVVGLNEVQLQPARVAQAHNALALGWRAAAAARFQGEAEARVELCAHCRAAAHKAKVVEVQGRARSEWRAQQHRREGGCSGQRSNLRSVARSLLVCGRRHEPSLRQPQPAPTGEVWLRDQRKREKKNFFFFFPSCSGVSGYVTRATT